MKLTAKLVGAFMLGMVVVLAMNGWFRAAREVNLFEQDMKRHAHVLGHALAISVSRVWRTSGEDAALQLVSEADERYNDLDVAWVSLDPEWQPTCRTDLLASELAQLDKGREIVRRVPHPDGPGTLITYVPIRVPDGRLGALQISESLATEREVLHTIIRSTALAMLALAGLLGLLAAILGFFLVGRPTKALVQKAHRIGQGDLGGPLSLDQRDELGEIAHEMNAMCVRLAASREKLAAETAARTAATEQLRHADRLLTVGKLASGIAHELGTPLNVVSGRAQMIVSGDSVGHEVTDSARIIVEQSKRMTQIIRQLLDFARPRRANKCVVELRTIIDQTVKLLEPMARKRGVILLVRAADSPGSSQLDDGQIQQALLNLVVNAIHATPPGGGVTIGWDERVATPPADHGGKTQKYLRLFVIDTGHGMNEETKARIFEPFFTTKPVGEGTGLGLSVTYGIVKEHQGWIDLVSEKDQGSTFSIFLPPIAFESAPHALDAADSDLGANQ